MGSHERRLFIVHSEMSHFPWQPQTLCRVYQTHHRAPQLCLCHEAATRLSSFPKPRDLKFLADPSLSDCRNPTLHVPLLCVSTNSKRSSANRAAPAPAAWEPQTSAGTAQLPPSLSLQGSSGLQLSEKAQIVFSCSAEDSHHKPQLSPSRV